MKSRLILVSLSQSRGKFFFANWSVFSEEEMVTSQQEKGKNSLGLSNRIPVQLRSYLL